MKQPLFSIIVPVYKVEQYLKRCVNSLINQTEKDIEIILVDDGSPDKCPEICDQYEKMDARVHVLHKKNGGLSDARNEGIKVANGKYIIFVDSDDYIEEDACEKFAELIMQPVDVIVGDAIVENSEIKLDHANVLGGYYTGKEYMLKSYSEGN